MYRYVIKDAKTGQVIASGTAAELVELGMYRNVDSVSACYSNWRRRDAAKQPTRQVWERSGTRCGPEHGPAARIKPPRRSVSRAQRAASRAWQDGVAADAAPKKPGGYTTEKLGELGALPEHDKKFAQPPVAPPQAKGNSRPSALRMDVYKLECLNWERRQQGKRALTYGEWRAGIR